MKYFVRHLIVLIIVSCHLSLVVGQIPVYAWRDHLSWNTAELVVIANRKAYCSNGVGIFTYDMTNRNMEKLTKTNGLSDVGITAMQYAAAVDAVVVGYANGNLDIVVGRRIHNIPEIKQSRLYANRRINDIFILGNRAYLSCAFGIVVVDLQSRHIRDTYIIGDNGIAVDVFSLTEFNGYFYAATAHGLKKADSQNRLLTDFSSWKTVSVNNIMQVVSTDRFLYAYDVDNQIFVYDGINWILLPTTHLIETVRRLTVSGNSLLVSASNGVFIFNTINNLLHNFIQSYNNLPITAFDAVIDNDGTYWIADNRRGLVRWRSGNSEFFAPNGPASNHAAAMRFKADRLLVAAGGRGDDGQPLNRQGEIHTFHANQWTTISPQDIYDFTDVDISENNPNVYYVTSWGNGLYVFENGNLTAHYTQHNSTLSADFWGNIFSGGLMMDSDNRLWVSNDRHIHLLADRQWRKLPFETDASFGRLTGDNFGQIWTTQGNNGLMVFSKNHEQNISFKPFNYTGSAPISLSNGIANAPDGVIWVATTQGPVLYRNPSIILNGDGLRGVHPHRIGTSEPSRVFALLGSENILSVAIDGANRKWFGTETAGVFLIDEDNAGEVKHFTVDNSPLFSNRVHDIAIDGRTGEVFFATQYGIVSYRSDATSSGDDFGFVYAFPNPVRPDYHGVITITGLIRDADVRITDIAGNLVYQTRSLGGQAVWNGQNLHGRRVATGVYLVFCTNDDGSKTHVTKILFVR